MYAAWREKDAEATAPPRTAAGYLDPKNCGHDSVLPGAWRRQQEKRRRAHPGVTARRCPLTRPRSTRLQAPSASASQAAVEHEIAILERRLAEWKGQRGLRPGGM